jgi:hypothetical protein
MKTLGKMLALYGAVLVLFGCAYWFYYQLSWPQASGCPTEFHGQRVEFPATVTGVQPQLFQGSFDALPAYVDLRDDHGIECAANLASGNWRGPGIGSHIRAKVRVGNGRFDGLIIDGWDRG